VTTRPRIGRDVCRRPPAAVFYSRLDALPIALIQQGERLISLRKPLLNVPSFPACMRLGVSGRRAMRRLVHVGGFSNDGSRLLEHRGSVTCEQPFVALKNILMQRARLYLIYTTGATTTICLDTHMKLATIALAIAFALPNTLAFAEGTLNYSAPAAHPVVRGVRLTRHAVIRPRNISPVFVIREPSGSTLTPLAMSRGG
jgi:hypothetical protein